MKWRKSKKEKGEKHQERFEEQNKKTSRETIKCANSIVNCIELPKRGNSLAKMQKL